MSYSNAGENFEPSVKTKNFWLYTRKSERNFGGITLPGLFQTRGMLMDTLATFLVILLEFFGLYVLVIYGDIKYFNAIFLFLADLLFVILKHFISTGYIIKYKNQIVLNSDGNEEARLISKINFRKFLSKLFSFLIISIALFKVLAFYATIGQLTGVTFLIILTYAIVAILHLSTTGYFLGNLWYSFFLFFDRRKFLKKNVFVIESHRDHVFTPLVKLKGNPISDFSNNKYPQEAILIQRETDYVLKSWGILDDDERDRLIMKQESIDAKRILASEILNHQMSNILPAEAQ